MNRLAGMARRSMLVVGLAAVMMQSGCELLGGMVEVAYSFSAFWDTTPLIPVWPFYSQQIEDTYWEEERYSRVPILDPVEGENAPILCLDPPRPDEVVRALQDSREGGVWFFTETQYNNVRMVVEPIVDELGECKFYPMVGPARLHKCHYRCTVYFQKIIRSNWPVPFMNVDDSQEVLYIDHDHLIRCTGPQTPFRPSY